jgi:hypothetical protein
MALGYVAARREDPGLVVDEGGETVFPSSLGSLLGSSVGIGAPIPGWRR